MVQIEKAVGRNCPNQEKDVLAIHNRLMQIAKIPCYASKGTMDDHVMMGIRSVQAHFMKLPDEVVSPHGLTIRSMCSWRSTPINAGVDLSKPGLRKAWNLVSPLLPAGSVCTSGYRSAADQRRILQNDAIQVKVVRLVAKANPRLFTGRVLKERNGCVHFEIH